MNQIINLYAIYDVKADSIQNELYPFVNDAIAKRGFSGIFVSRDPRFAVLQQHPGDFFVYKVGSLSLEGTGKLLSAEPERLCCLTELNPEGSPNA